jgi:hypothetical protein
MTTDLPPNIEEGLQRARRRPSKRRTTRYTDRRAYALAKNGWRALGLAGAAALTFAAMLAGSSGTIVGLHMAALGVAVGAAATGLAAFMLAARIERTLAAYDELARRRSVAWQRAAEARAARRTTAPADAVTEVFERPATAPEPAVELAEEPVVELAEQ